MNEWDKLLEKGDTESLLNYDIRKIDPEIDRAKLTAQVSNSLKQRLMAYLLEHQVSIKRDKANVKKIVDQGRSGIYLTGLLHVDPTLNLLQQACRATKL